MIFTCLPPTGPCEWRELRPFVVAFNKRHGTSYSRSKCLDIEIRDRPAPEVLIEAPGKPPIVIERKSIVWPPEEHLSNHSNEHHLLGYFAAELRSQGDDFRDSLYLLSVQATSLAGRADRDIAATAGDIARIVSSDPDKAKSTHGIARSSPIAWNFRAAREWERDETTPTRGIGILIDESTEYDDSAEFLRRRASALSGFSEEFDRQARSAARKFSDYTECLRLLLVQFFGDIELGPTEDEIKSMIVGSQLPEGIDQVWVADKNWVSAYNFEVQWVRMV